MTWMILPIAACAIIVLTLGWFGLHVLQRGVIFVDLALAQVAALGTTYAVYLGHEPESGMAFALSLVFTFIGAGAFSATRLFEERVPQEAIIGIAYAVSAATGILMIHFADDPHGGEKLEHLLVGNIVWVQPGDIALLAGVCGTVGIVHWFVRRRFLQISYEPAQAVREGRQVALWDLLFYVSFGFALTAIVAVSGVLLVFSYLVIPAVVARLLVEGVARRLVLAWAVGLVVSMVGVALTYSHPTGPAIVGLFGVVLVATLAWYAVWHAEHQGRAFAQAAGALGGVALVLWGFGRLPVGEAHAEGGPTAEGQAAEGHALDGSVEEEATADALLAADPAARDAGAREAAGRPDRVEALAAALAVESDESVKLTMACVLARAGDTRGLVGLAQLTSAEAPFLRMEADSRLRGLAGSGAPAFDPVAGPDGAGLWAAWVASQTAMPAGFAEIAMP
jgi:zinc/manganese transport system permease protein